MFVFFIQTKEKCQECENLGVTFAASGLTLCSATCPVQMHAVCVPWAINLFHSFCLFVVQQHKKLNCRKLRDTHKCAVLATETQSRHCTSSESTWAQVQLGGWGHTRHTLELCTAQNYHPETQRLHNCIRTCLHLYSTAVPKNCHSVMEKDLPGEQIKREQQEEQKHLWNLHCRLSLIPPSIFPTSSNWHTGSW